MNPEEDGDGASEHTDEHDILVGNAALDGAGATRGWFVGHFISPPESLHCTEVVEVKWGIHPLGDARPEMAPGASTTTLSVLVSGSFRVLFLDREVVLSAAGDYVLFPPGVPHGWIADADSVVMTVRWPSKRSDTPEPASIEAS